MLLASSPAWSLSGALHCDRANTNAALCGFASDVNRESITCRDIFRWQRSAHMISLSAWSGSNDPPLNGSDKALPIRQAREERGVELQSSRNIDDIYSLAPMQRGMLFHDLLSSGSQQRPYIQQVLWRIDEGADRIALRSAWQHVIARHPVLRTFVVWENRNQPISDRVPRGGASLARVGLERYAGTRGDRCARSAPRRATPPRDSRSRALR